MPVGVLFLTGRDHLLSTKCLLHKDSLVLGAYGRYGIELCVCVRGEASMIKGVHSLLVLEVYL